LPAVQSSEQHIEKLVHALPLAVQLPVPHVPFLQSWLQQSLLPEQL
jgi:hypothetical protein